MWVSEVLSLLIIVPVRRGGLLYMGDRRKYGQWAGLDKWVTLLVHGGVPWRRGLAGQIHPMFLTTHKDTRNEVSHIWLMIPQVPSRYC